MPTSQNTFDTNHQHELQPPVTSSTFGRTSGPDPGSAPGITSHHADAPIATDEEFRRANLDKLMDVSSHFGDQFQGLLTSYGTVDPSRADKRTAILERIRELLTLHRQPASLQYKTARRALIGLQLHEIGHSQGEPGPRCDHDIHYQIRGQHNEEAILVRSFPALTSRSTSNAPAVFVEE